MTLRRWSVARAPQIGRRAARGAGTYEARSPWRSRHLEAARLEGSPWTPYIYIAPIALYLLLFQGYPLVQELLLSFTSTSLLSPQDNVPVGLDNYRELLEHERLPQHDPDHSDLHHRLRRAVDRARTRGGAASRPAVPGARRGARGGHHSLGGAVGCGGAHLHLDLQRAVRRLQLSPSARSGCRRATRTGSTIRASRCRRSC